MDHLARLANNPFFVFGAYFFAFFPWGVMSKIDFISEKWRTIRRTRKLAYIHLASSVVPVIYVAAYAEAQRRVDDWKECGAAMAALFFNLMHLMRTIVGMIQLGAFVAWCKHAMECVRALNGRKGEDETEKMENVVKVNNTVVDNELEGRDVTVTPSWKKVWNGMKKREFRPSSWLVTDQAKLCTVRWSGALLCGMGEVWFEKNWGYNGAEFMNLFFSCDFSSLRHALQEVTWNISGGNCDFELLRIPGLGDWTDGGLSGEMSAAYGTKIPWYVFEQTFSSYSFEFNGLKSSYPSSNSDYESDNRENVTLGLVDSVVLAKHFGVEKLREIRRYYDRYRLPTNSIRHEAVNLLLKQLKLHSSHDPKILHMFLDESEIPIFPYRMQLVASWEVSTNWRVLQVSAHQDIENSWSAGDVTKGRIPLFQVEPRPDSVFNYCAEFAKDLETELEWPSSLGVLIETVRTFLAEWLLDGARKPDWEPTIPTDCFEFAQSENLPDVYFRNDISRIWACQDALQKEVARTSNPDENLPSNHALIMLFLLGFPLIRVEDVDAVDATDSDSPRSQSAVPEACGSLSSSHHSVNVSVRVWHVFSILAPQNISVVIRHDSETHRISLKLKNDSDGAQFLWQDWVDAAMGYLNGIEEVGKGELKYVRTIARANLREPVVKLCPLNVGYNGSVTKTGTASIWMGWPPFDLKVCKFEVEHWLAACDIKLSALCNRDGEETAVDLEIECAERLIESIILVKNNDL